MKKGEEIQYLLPGSDDKCGCGKEAIASVGRFHGDRKIANGLKWVNVYFLCNHCLNVACGLGSGEYMTHEQAIMIEVGMILEIRKDWAKNHYPYGKCEVISVRKGVSQTGVFVAVRAEDGKEFELDAAWFEPPKYLIPF